MDNPVDLSFERRKRLGMEDNSSLSPADLLKMVLADVENTETNESSADRAYVIVAKSTPGGLAFTAYRCGMNSLEEIGLLDAVKQDALLRVLE